MRKKYLGFTLIEILLTIAIVGIISAGAIAIIDPVGQFKKARDSVRKADLALFQEPLQLYFQDNGEFPVSTSNYKIKNKDGATIDWGSSWQPYMQNLPKDSLISQNYAYVSTDGKSYRLFTKLERCNDSQILSGIDCATAKCNYSITSSNITPAMISDPLPTCIFEPTPTPAPTSTPTPTPTHTPTPFHSPTPTPTPLPEGPSHKRVFLTSTVYNGDLKSQANVLPGPAVTTGLQGGDKICQNRANAASLGGTWEAWLSDSSASANSRLNHSSVPYKLLNNVIVADNWDDLVSSNPTYLQNSIDRYENNHEIIKPPSTIVWTGTHEDGASSSESCSNWTTNSSIINGAIGIANAIDFVWTNWINEDSDSDRHCDRQRKIYCFEQ